MLVAYVHISERIITLMETGPIETISVIGAGTMGAQIALLCAVHGCQVRIFSRSEQTLQRAAQGHVQELEKHIHNQSIPVEEKANILERIHPTTNIQEAAEQTDLVIETAP